MKKNLLITMLLLSAFASNAANYYWVGGTGNWSDVTNHWATTSGGNTFQSIVPSSLDNVFFDANSFSSTGQTVTGDIVMNCNNMSWAGVANSPTFTTNNSLNIYGSLTFVSGMTLTTGDVYFQSTSTGQTITLGGKSISGNVWFEGSGGWTFQDTFTSGGAILIDNGSIVTNNQTVNTFYVMVHYNNSTNTINLNVGSSTFTVSYSQPWTLQGSNLTYTSSNPTFIMTGNGTFIGGGYAYYNISFTGGSTGTINGVTSANDINFTGAGTVNGATFHNVTFGGNATLNGSNTFNNLTFGAGATNTFQNGTTQTVNGTLTSNSSCTAFSTYTTDNGSTATISKATGTVTLDYVNLSNIIATGAATFNATNAIATGTNTGWNITNLTGRNLYWIGNGGNWSDGSHWSLTSGGAAVNCTPNSLDNVFFDANSFTGTGQTVTVDISTISCNNMSWVGVTNNPTFNQNDVFNLYGSLTYVSGMTINGGTYLYFLSNSPGQTITCAGHQIGNVMTFNGTGGWTLQDAFTFGGVEVNHGSFTTNGQTINGQNFNVRSGNATTVDIGSSTFNLSQDGLAWQWTGVNTTFISNHPTINFTGNTVQMIGGGLTYYDINYTGTNNCQISGIGSAHDVNLTGATTITGPSTFNNVSFGGNSTFNGNNTFHNLTLGAGATNTFGAGTTQTVNGVFTSSGSCAAFSTFTTDGSTATLSVGSGTITLDYLSLNNIIASGGATFNATHAIATGTNTGWNITNLTGRNVYWIGGTGNWSDGTHWSLTSGGTSLNCTPNSLDNVFFDANSFSSNGQTVTVDILATCNNMNWTGSTNNPTFTINNNFSDGLNIYGSLTYVSGMTLTANQPHYFRSINTGQTITLAGQKLKWAYFEGVGGEWTFQDPFNTSEGVIIDNGSVITNNQPVTVYYITSGSGTTRSLNVGSSSITVSWPYPPFDIQGPNLTYTSNNPTFTILNGGTFNGGGYAYYDINFTGSSAGTITGVTSAHNISFTKNGTVNGAAFNNASFGGNATLNGSNSFNDLTFYPGTTVTLQNGNTQTVTGTLTATGTGGFPIVIQSDNSSAATISKSSGSVCLDYIHLQNITGTGGATFDAGINPHSTDLGGNTNFAFTGSCTLPASPPYLWNGSNSTDWTTTTNWSPNIVPLSGNDVTISYSNNAPVISTTTAVNNLTINTSASLTINSPGILTVNGTGTNNGTLTVASGGSLKNSSAISNVTLQQSVVGQRGFRVFANPFSTSQTIASVASTNGITIGTSVPSSGLTDSRIFSSNAWANITGTIWAANTPYALFIRGLTSEVTGLNYTGGPSAFTYSVSGTLNGNSTSITPANTSDFILVGNPYAAPVNTQALTGQNPAPYYTYQIAVSGTPQVDAGGWVASGGNSNISTTIPVLGVVAYKPASTSTFNITTSDINTGGTLQTGLFGVEPSTTQLELLVEQSGYFKDKMFVRLDATATTNGTDYYELKKLYNTNVNVYSITPDDSRMAIDARNVLSTIPLGISALPGNYNFKLSNNNLPVGTTVYLNDKLLNTQAELKAGDVYNFSITSDAATHGEQRFSLSFSSKTTLIATDPTDGLTANVLGNITNSNLIAVQIAGATAPVTIAIKDMSGKAISNVNAVNGIQYVNVGNAASGMLILQISDGKNSVTKKVIKL